MNGLFSWAHFCSSRFCTLLASLRPPIRSILTNICNTPGPILCERIYFHLAHAAVWLHGCISTSVAIYAAMNVFVCVRVHSFSAVVHTAVLISMIDEAKRNTHTPTKCGYKETVREKLYTGDTLTVKRTCALLITMLAAGVKNQLMRKFHCLRNQSFLFKLLNFSGAKRKKLGTDKEKRSSSKTMSQCMSEWHINVAHFRVD